MLVFLQYFSRGELIEVELVKELLVCQYMITTQTYLILTNSDLEKTQSLLKYARGVEEHEEELTPMPERIIIKDKNLFNQFRNPITSFQLWLGRVVSNYLLY